MCVPQVVETNRRQACPTNNPLEQQRKEVRHDWLPLFSMEDERRVCVARSERKLLRHLCNTVRSQDLDCLGIPATQPLAADSRRPSWAHDPRSSGANATTRQPAALVGGTP